MNTTIAAKETVWIPEQSAVSAASALRYWSVGGFFAAISSWPGEPLSEPRSISRNRKACRSRGFWCRSRTARVGGWVSVLWVSRRWCRETVLFLVPVTARAS